MVGQTVERKKRKKLISGGNKTVDQHSGANLKNVFFCKNLLQFSCFFSSFAEKNAENDYFDQHPNAGRNIQQLRPVFV